MTEPTPHAKTMPALMLGALGVVYGDIGTSPLYAVKEAFSGVHGLDAGMTNVMGVLSMMFWLLMIIVTIKYVVLVLRADNQGEGGDFALLALNLKLTARRPWLHYSIGLLGILGGCLFYADAVITPAISVLSAVEGVKVYYAGLKPFVIPAALSILMILFLLQRHGTARVGFLFGPITLVWFVTIGVLGAASIVQTPEIAQALSPHYAVHFITHYPAQAFLACAAIVLVVTGAEALYADMGHFGRFPIRWMWALVAVSLVLNYFGQGALLLREPELADQAIFNPFYKLVPEIALIPMIILATLATVVASQATISGAFSITRQAMQLGYIPRLKIVHTSSATVGQVYLPFVNWAMLIAVIVVVMLFQTSSGLAAAYGIAVTGAMMVTTIAISIVMIKGWHWPWPVVLVILGFFLAIETTLLAANVTKVASGGWLPLVTALVLFILLTTWYRGQKILNQRLNDASQPMRDFVEDMVKQNYRRVPGVAVYMTPRKYIMPEVMMMNLKFNQVLHEKIVLLTVQTITEPRLTDGNRFEIQELTDGVFRVVVRYGFIEEPNLAQDLASCMIDGVSLLAPTVVYFLGHESIVPRPGDGMALWREHLYAWMKRNAGSARDFYQVPVGRTVEMGGQYEI